MSASSRHSRLPSLHRRLGWLFAALSLAIPSVAVAAPPYQIFAVYARAGGDDTTMELKNGMLIPDVGDGWRLKTIRVTFKREGLGSVTPAVFRNFVIHLSDGVQQRDVWKSVEADKLDPSVDVDVLPWSDQVGDGARKTALTVEVQGKFSREFLCSQELLYRHDNGDLRSDLEAKAKTSGKKPAKTAKTSDAVFTHENQRPQYVLMTKKQGGSEIIYSFCKDEAENINWKAAAQSPEFSLGESDPEKVHQAQKKALTDLLVKSGALSKFNVLYEKDSSVTLGGSAGFPTNVYIEDHMGFFVLRTGALFFVHEEANDGFHPLSTLIDQASTIAVRAESVRGVCPDVREAPFIYKLKEAGKDPKVLDLVFRDNCSAKLDVAFKDYLDKTVTFNIVYQFSDAKKTEVILYQSSFEVANLGLITSFPVISEVYSAVTKPSLRDVEAASSIPVSYALPLTGASPNTIAVTFPWKLSYNTRRAPKLANYFSIFPHMSVIASDTSSSAKLSFALGAGVSLAQFLSISWAATAMVGEKTQHYLLFGVSIPDIAKLFVTAGH